MTPTTCVRRVEDVARSGREFQVGDVVSVRAVMDLDCHQVTFVWRRSRTLSPIMANRTDTTVGTRSHRRYDPVCDLYATLGT